MEYEKYQERVNSERSILDAFVQVSCEALERYDARPLSDIGVLAVAQAQVELRTLGGEVPEIKFELLRNVLNAIALAPELGNPYYRERSVNSWLLGATSNRWLSIRGVNTEGQLLLENELQKRSSIV